MNFRTLVINDGLQLDRVLESTNLDEYELTDMPIEQFDESPLELMGVRLAPKSDMLSTSGLAPRNRSSHVLRS